MSANRIADIKVRTGLGAAVAIFLAFGPQTQEQILEKLREQALPLPENPLIALDTVIKPRCEFDQPSCIRIGPSTL